MICWTLNKFWTFNLFQCSLYWSKEKFTRNVIQLGFVKIVCMNNAFNISKRECQLECTIVFSTKKYINSMTHCAGSHS